MKFIEHLMFILKLPERKNNKARGIKVPFWDYNIETHIEGRTIAHSQFLYFPLNKQTILLCVILHNT